MLALIVESRAQPHDRLAAQVDEQPVPFRHLRAEEFRKLLGRHRAKRCASAVPPETMVSHGASFACDDLPIVCCQASGGNVLGSQRSLGSSSRGMVNVNRVSVSSEVTLSVPP
jgi:hypothetical protein